MENLNDREYLHNTKMQVIENLRQIQGAPGVQMQRWCHVVIHVGV